MYKLQASDGMMEMPINAGKILWQSGRKAKVRVAVGGDFLPTMALEGTPSKHWQQNAEFLSSYFSDIDCAVVNLECPLACDGISAVPKLGVGSSLFGTEEALQYLKALKISLVGIANNHMMDFGPEGVLRTHDALLSSGIDFLGAPACMGEDPEIKVIDLNGVKVGYWTAFLNAGKTETGNTGIESATAIRARKSLIMMGKEVTCRIALIHAGLEKTNFPDPYELKTLHGFIEDGFDLVCVCHSHRVSGYAKIMRTESLYPGFCFHGLGSFLSGCIYGELEREGLIAVLGLDECGKPAELSVRPIWLEGPGWGIVPSRDREQVILNRFEKLSKKIENGSFKKDFYNDMGRDLVSRAFCDLSSAFKNQGLVGVAAKLYRIRPKHLNRLLNKVFK